MYLRHENRDSVFLKNRMSYFGNISNLTPYQESSFLSISEVGRNTIFLIAPLVNFLTACFLYYLGVADNLGKTDLSCDWLYGEIGWIWNCMFDVFWKVVREGVPQNWQKCILYLLYVLFYILYVLFYIF